MTEYGKEDGYRGEEEDNDLCPRDRAKVEDVAFFEVATDSAIMEVARQIVAGGDEQYDIHPNYEEYIKSWGKERAKELIRRAAIHPHDDSIQTHLEITGSGLYGGLDYETGFIGDDSKYIFFEWADARVEHRTTTITLKQARDIVEGKLKEIEFRKVKEETS